MTLEDKFTIEERTKLSGYLLDNEESIEVPEFGTKIKYKKRISKPTSGRLLGKVVGVEYGVLDATFIVSLTMNVKVIDVRLLLSYNRGFISDRVCITHQPFDSCAPFSKPQIMKLEHLKDYSRNLAFDYAKICHDKIMELYKELIKPSK